MNLFVLDRDPVESAAQQCDSHLAVSIVSACRILAEALRDMGYFTPFACAQHGSPLSAWARRDRPHLDWTISHLVALCEESGSRLRRGAPESALDLALYAAQLKPDTADFLSPGCAASGPVFHPIVLPGLESLPPIEAYRRHYASREAEWAHREMMDALARAAAGDPPRRPGTAKLMRWTSPASRPDWMPRHPPRHEPSPGQLAAARSWGSARRVEPKHLRQDEHDYLSGLAKAL